MIENIGTIKKIGDIPLYTLNTDYVRIENLQQYMHKILRINPLNEINYIEYWQQQKKIITEGLWGQESQGYRYMPGALYFYGNYTLIQDTDESKVTTYIKPTITDLEWEIFYGLMEAEGFSGYYDDDMFTSDELIFTYNKKFPETFRERQLFNSKGEKKRYITPRENIRKLHKEPKGVPLWFNEAKNYLILGCHHEDSLIRLYNGDTKKAKNIKVNDLLMGPDSLPRKVTETYSGESNMFKISPRYNEDFTVTAAHILRLRKRKYKYAHDPSRKHIIYEDVNMSILDYASLSDNKKRQYELVHSEGVEYPEIKNILDPYFIGLWLGNGFKREKLICYSEKDKEIQNWLINYSKSSDELSHTITNYDSQLGDEKMYRFRLIHNKLLYKNNWWSKTFRNNKHIPNEYLINSKENRLKLLAGLIDSDGNYDGKRFTITNTDYNLLLQIQELCRSLGFRAQLNKPHRSGITNSVKYNLRITGKITQIPTQLKRKQATEDCNFNKRGCNKNNFTITPVGIQKFVGFEVDKDNLYCMHDYLVDHNSRGGGKSYSVALGKALHQIVTDGANYYNNGDFYTLPDYQEVHDNTLVEIVVGSGDTDKSSEFLNKIKASMNVLAINPAFGVWGEPGDEDYTPNPLYKDMAGSLSPGNKKNPWRHEYKVISKGRETYDGTNSKIYHVSYSAQKAKGKGAQAAAGGRTKYSIVEETGLTQNAIDVYNSNNNIVARNGVQFGVQCFLGTSGNIDAIQQTKRMFLNPQDYNIVAYKDSWEGMGKDGMIGFFLPAYLTYRQFKDKDGNTDFAKAFEHVYRNRKRFSSSDASVIREEKMNRPIVPSEMWLQSKGYYLPYEEGVTREKALVKNNAYLDLALPVTLSFDSYQPNGIAYKIDNKADPFYNFPIDSTKTSHEGSIVIYDLPKFDAPNDFYFFTHDPYVSENIDDGGSLGVTHGFISPKYWNEYMPPSGPMVCTYIGKPEKGLSQYYLNQEKLVQFYGDPVRGLAYEANKGSDCKNYYMNKNKEYLLTLRPVVHDSKRIYSTRVNEYGYVVGNKMDKLVKLKRLNDWLLEELPNGLRFIETLPCLFSTKQIVAYELDGNFDAVSSMIMGAVHVGILESQLQTEAIKKREKNELAFLSQNKIFNENGNDFKRSRFNHHWPK